MSTNGHSGTQGTALKATSGWNYCGNGADNFGFSALPGGARDDYFGNTADAGTFGFWWSSSPNGGNAWYRLLGSFDPVIERYGDDPRFGMSVRCLRDAD